MNVIILTFVDLVWRAIMFSQVKDEINSFPKKTMPYDFEYLVINIPAYGDAGVSLQLIAKIP